MSVVGWGFAMGTERLRPRALLTDASFLALVLGFPTPPYEHAKQEEDFFVDKSKSSLCISLCFFMGLGRIFLRLFWTRRGRDDDLDVLGVGLFRVGHQIFQRLLPG